MSIRVFYNSENPNSPFYSLPGTATIHGSFNAEYSARRGDCQHNITVDILDHQDTVILALQDNYHNPYFITLNKHREQSSQSTGLYECKETYPESGIMIQCEIDGVKSTDPTYMIKIDGNWYGSGNMRNDIHTLKNPDVICAYIAGAASDEDVDSASTKFKEGQSELDRLRQELIFSGSKLEQTENKLRETNDMLHMSTIALKHINDIAKWPLWKTLVRMRGRINTIRDLHKEYIKNLEGYNNRNN